MSDEIERIRARDEATPRDLVTAGYGQVHKDRLNGFATCSVEVTKSTPKAVQVRRIYGDRASTWLPRSVLRRNEKHEFGGFDVAAWFVRKVAAGADPYARIALGLSCW